MNAELAPLTSFILPSGLARRSPRCTSPGRSSAAPSGRRSRCNEAEPLNPQLLAYLNRLSDHLFVAARHRRGARRRRRAVATRGDRG